MGKITSMLDNLGEFLTKSRSDNKFQNTEINSPEQFAYFRERAILAQSIRYYAESLDRELAMAWSIKGKAREQIVEVASAVKETTGGEYIDSSAVIVDDDEGEEEDA